MTAVETRGCVEADDWIACHAHDGSLPPETGYILQWSAVDDTGKNSPPPAGYSSVSVMSRHGRLLPLRIGFWRKGNAYEPVPLLCAVEPPMADMLELKKLSAYGHKVTYSPSMNRQCHTYAITERRDARSLALRRVFTRCVSIPLLFVFFKSGLRIRAELQRPLKQCPLCSNR